MKRRALICFCLFPLITGCQQRGADTLQDPLGITVVQDGKENFHELIAAEQKLPQTLSQTFTTDSPTQTQVEVTLSQKHSSGLEKVATMVMDVPARPAGTSQVIVTLKISAEKKLRLKATAIETGQVKEFGPYPVE